MKNQGLPQSEISLFEVFQSIGYRTIGKWDLGYNEPYLPQNKGIDKFYGFYNAFSLYAPISKLEIANHRHRIFQNKMIWRKGRKGASAIVREGEEIE